MTHEWRKDANVFSPMQRRKRKKRENLALLAVKREKMFYLYKITTCNITLEFDT
jgi:hypothetical protein